MQTKVNVGGGQPLKPWTPNLQQTPRAWPVMDAHLISSGFLFASSSFEISLAGQLGFREAEGAAALWEPPKNVRESVFPASLKADSSSRP